MAEGCLWELVVVVVVASLDEDDCSVVSELELELEELLSATADPTYPTGNQETDALFTLTELLVSSSSAALRTFGCNLLGLWS